MELARGWKKQTLYCACYTVWALEGSKGNGTMTTSRFLMPVLHQCPDLFPVAVQGPHAYSLRGEAPSL